MAGNIREACYSDLEGADTSRDNTEDSQLLLNIFPEEIWLQILHYVTNSEDLTQVTNASPVWRKLLHPRKVEYMFSEVWDIVGAGFEKLTRNLHDTLPKPWTREALSLRLVHPMWKKVLDDFYCVRALPSAFTEEASDERQFPPGRSHWEDPSWAGERFHWNTPSIFYFLEHFEDTHGKGGSSSTCGPLIRRRVHFHVRSTGDTEQFLSYERGIFQLLRAYGHHVRWCTLELQFLERPTTEAFSNLRQWICLMPNLTCLSIHFLGISCGDLDEQSIYVRELQPLAKLEKLEYLLLYGFPPLVANFLAESYNHVSILHLQASHLNQHYDVTTTPFPNLQDLVLSCDTMSNFQKLEAAEFSSSFKRLEIKWRLGGPSLPEVFALVGRKWGASLKICNMFLDHYSCYFPPTEITALKRQYLPGLTELDWDNIKRHNYGFGTPNKSLWQKKTNYALLRSILNLQL